MSDGTSETGLTMSRLPEFLFGDRGSITLAARDRSSLWIGLIFVFVAGLAREYDGADLRREPWHLFVPIVASVAVSMPIFLLVRCWRDSDRTRIPFWADYLRFLSLFWLTAPLALLYAIPYERFMAPEAAMFANLWTLAAVAVWRVILISRISSVVFGRTFKASFFLVMLVADLFALAAMSRFAAPTLQIMGGIRLRSGEAALSEIALLLVLGTVFTIPIWLLGARRALPAFDRGPRPVFPELRVSHRATFVCAVLCAVPMLAALPITQREQRLRTDTELLLRAGRIDEAMTLMSRHAQSEYPPSWDPPPRIGWSEPEVPDVLAVMHYIAGHETAPWVRAIYLDKFDRRWLTQAMLFDSARIREVNAILNAVPEAKLLRTDYVNNLLSAAEEPVHTSVTQPTTGATP